MPNAREMCEGGFSVRRATDEDTDAIVRLVSQMHGHDVLDRVAWLYRGNPHGQAVSWVAADQVAHDVVGVASVFPRDVFVNGVQVRAGVGGDCFILRRARRRGLATRLHRATRTDLTALGLEFVYGPASAENLLALFKAGSRGVTTFERFVRPLSARFFSKRIDEALPGIVSAATLGLGSRLLGRLAQGFFRLRSPTAGDVGATAQAVEGFGPEWDEWRRENTPSFGVFCSRDAAYLTHRYGAARSPDLTPYVIRSEDGLRGMFVLRLRDEGGAATLVDFFTKFDLASMRAGLRVAVRRCTELGCDAVQVHSTPHALLGRALRAEGFVRRDRKEPLLFPLLLAGDRSPRAGLLDGSAWYFLEGDRDAGDGHIQRTSGAGDP